MQLQSIEFDDEGLPTAKFDDGEIRVVYDDKKYVWVTNADGSEQVVEKRTGYKVELDNVLVLSVPQSRGSKREAFYEWVQTLRSAAEASGDWEPPEEFYAI